MCNGGPFTNYIDMEPSCGQEYKQIPEKMHAATVSLVAESFFEGGSTSTIFRFGGSKCTFRPRSLALAARARSITIWRMQGAQLFRVVILGNKEGRTEERTERKSGQIIWALRRVRSPFAGIILGCLSFCGGGGRRREGPC